MKPLPLELNGQPVKRFEQKADWAAWLEDNHATSPGIWLNFAKKGSTIESVSYYEAVEVALCYGWIDSRAKGFDESSWLQKYSPRRAKSIWSKINRKKAEELIEAGRMKPAGMAAIEAAKADGRWDAAYDSPGTSAVPEDLQVELDKNPRAKSFFETLDSRNRYAFLHRIQTAKKAETRAKRIQQFIQMLEKNEKLYP
jgi:uncharacterized protein YdeI (YjbR/CyaY-like superfamily)